MTVTFIPGRTSGSRNFIHDKYRYCLGKKRDDKTYWKCTDKTCSGRLNLINDTIVTITEYEASSPPSYSCSELSLHSKKNMKRGNANIVLTLDYIRTNKCFGMGSYLLSGDEKSFLFRGTVKNMDRLAEAPHPCRRHNLEI